MFDNFKNGVIIVDKSRQQWYIEVEDVVYTGYNPTQSLAVIRKQLLKGVTPVIISVGNWEIAIKVQEQDRPEIAEKIHRQIMQQKQIERDRDMAYARLFLGRGNHYN